MNEKFGNCKEGIDFLQRGSLKWEVFDNLPKVSKWLQVTIIWLLNSKISRQENVSKVIRTEKKMIQCCLAALTVEVYEEVIHKLISR